MKKYILHRLTLLLLGSMLVLPALHSQTYPMPELPDTSGFGRMIQRTMKLLATSTTEKKNTVKILVYGQSISEQDWWLEVRRYLQAKFPKADLVMENRSIGGFSSQFLKKTVRMDVDAFCPDLVIFHVYGSHIDYETIIKDIRSNTTAEIAMWTDHYTGPDSWSDQMSYTTLPGFAEKYGCELIRIREEWIKYLDANNLQPSDLLKDGVHLNDYGNFLLAELIKPYLNYKPAFTADTFNMVKYFEVGTDVSFNGDTLTLPFDGNRVELVAQNTGFNNQGWATIFVDDHKPTDFQGTWFYTRPYDNMHAWPWNLGAWVETEHLKPPVKETWTLEYTSATVPYLHNGFTVTGSVTGTDGSGNTDKDFVSDSKRVLFKGGEADLGDWHIKRSYDVVGTQIFAGQKVKWDVYSTGVDEWHPTTQPDLSLENAFTIIQGIDNNHHVLKIVKSGSGTLPLLGIRIYRPMWDRKDNYILSTDLHQITFEIEGGSKDINITSNSVWDVKPGAGWVSADVNTTSGNSQLTVSAGDNQDGYDREAYLVINGVNGVTDSVKISQPGGLGDGISDQKVQILQIYPNPASDYITIKTQGSDIESVIITDDTGRMVKQLSGRNPATLNISINDLSAGIYFVRMKTGNQTGTGKFVITGMLR